jgi:hypothetical protein
VNAVELVMTPTLQGYYVLEEDGTIHPTASAGTRQSFQREDSLCGYETVSSHKQSYFLLQDGSIITIRELNFLENWSGKLTPWIWN